MAERRLGERHLISFPIRVEWKDDKGEEVVEEGLTENIGPSGILIHLPRLLPNVGSKVNVTVTENPATTQVTVTAQVLRLERNAAHPQAALMLVGSTKDWEKEVWQYAGDVLAAQKPDNFDDWN
ncbi:MAG: PilZ domain-containing protein [Pyrinomonadaceae bacterium]|nr:PilZ domain-containing protein [Pyrinomonadaceae bacterium]